MTKKKSPAQPAIHRARASASRDVATFASLLQALSPKPALPVPHGIHLSAPLAYLDYARELAVKDEGLRSFWQQHQLPGLPEPVLASPRPRGYRTTSSRKAHFHGGKLYLLLGETKVAPPKTRVFQPSPLEPEEHARIYSFLQKKISEPAFRLVANHLNYLIIRGSYTQRAVIFNVDTLNGPLVRKLKLLANHLQALPEPVDAAFIYPDPTGSTYYLEERRPPDLLHFKKLCGNPYLAVTFHGCRYHFHPTSFSQVNEAMVPVMLQTARELLAPTPQTCLLDLYCGYGLFSHFLAPEYAEVLGIDAEGPSIREAAANKKLNAGSGKTRFVARRITSATLQEVLPPPFSHPEAVLLDPPRQGIPDEVIETLCHRTPRQILHIFCGVDQIPSSLKVWQRHGYEVRRIVPLDMFPGTANLEVLILLSKKL